MRNIFVSNEHFEGPLDLLLHLVKENELNIFDIDVVALAEQYLKALREWEFADLTQASAFVDMAATLVQLKSRRLLPSQRDQGEDEEQEEDLEAQEELLKKQLLELNQIKEASVFLEARRAAQNGILLKGSSEHLRLGDVYGETRAPLTGDPVGLVMMFEHMLREFVERKPAIVESKLHLMSQEEISQKLKDKVERLSRVYFKELFDEIQSRYEWVVYILAMLELAKEGALVIVQENPKGLVWLFSPDYFQKYLDTKTSLEPSKSIEHQ